MPPPQAPTYFVLSPLHLIFGARRFLMTAGVLVLLIIIGGTSLLHAQSSGRLTGSVRVASGAPAPNVQIVATNQVNGKWKRTRSDGSGKYSLQLSAGAYRLKVAPPFVAKFEKDKNYGEF